MHERPHHPLHPPAVGYPEEETMGPTIQFVEQRRDRQQQTEGILRY